MSWTPKSPAERDRKDRDRFPGLVLMAIGGMVAALCGSCTIATIKNLGVVSLVIGGVPTALGAWLFLAGLRMFRDP